MILLKHIYGLDSFLRLLYHINSVGLGQDVNQGAIKILVFLNNFYLILKQTLKILFIIFVLLLLNFISYLIRLIVHFS